MKEHEGASGVCRIAHTPTSPAVRAVRQAGALFFAIGVLGLLEYGLPGGVGYHKFGTIVVDAVGIIVGLLSWTPLAALLTGSRSLLMALVGFLTVAVGNAVGVLAPVPIGIYFVIIFMWVGQWHPRGTSLRLAPLGAMSYVIPFYAGAPAIYGAVPSVALVIPASVIAGEALAHHTSALRQAQREQQEALEALARANQTDDLTGLGNRRLGNKLLEALRPGDAVVILDLDDFKRVNDEYGHASGDQLLQQLGDFLRAEIREADTVARMGGEEFMLVLRDATPESIESVAGRLVAAWRTTKPLATLSAGAAIHPARQSPSKTYSVADSALYEAKTGGRDRLVLA